MSTPTPTQRVYKARQLTTNCIGIHEMVKMDFALQLASELEQAQAKLAAVEADRACEIKVAADFNQAAFDKVLKEREELRSVISGCVATMECWAEELGKDPCNNDTYCRAKDAIKHHPTTAGKP